MEIKKCLHCNKIMFSKNYNKGNWLTVLFCCKECKKLHKYKPRKPLPLTKICKECGKKFYKYDYSYMGGWGVKVFCCEKCRKSYYIVKNPQLKQCFHNSMVKEINTQIKGKINVIQSVPDLVENEDISTPNTNYEIEIINGSYKWKKKYNRYKDSNKKHTIIFVINSNLDEYFDKIMIYDKKSKKLIDF